jgi:hypothetical protein
LALLSAAAIEAKRKEEEAKRQEEEAMRQESAKKGKLYSHT